MWQAIENCLATLRAAEWMPMTAARVLIGIFFCISGGTKLFVPAKFSEMQQTLIQSHIPFPHANSQTMRAVRWDKVRVRGKILSYVTNAYAGSAGTDVQPFASR